IAQIKFKVTPQLLKPSFKKLNPLAGFKKLLGPQSLVEAGKSIAKMLVIGVVVFSALWPHLSEFGQLVGLPPRRFAPELAHLVFGIAIRAACALVPIAVLD